MTQTDRRGFMATAASGMALVGLEALSAPAAQQTFTSARNGAKNTKPNLKNTDLSITDKFSPVKLDRSNPHPFINPRSAVRFEASFIGYLKAGNTITPVTTRCLGLQKRQQGSANQAAIKEGLAVGKLQADQKKATGILVCGIKEAQPKARQSAGKVFEVYIAYSSNGRPAIGKIDITLNKKPTNDQAFKQTMLKNMKFIMAAAAGLQKQHSQQRR